LNQSSRPRYLTKSKFKIALECPTKLFYAGQRGVYFDKNSDNDFLQSLADGGHQIGELAKYKYHPDPIGAGITVETLDYDKAIRITQEKLAAESRAVVAEAALLVHPYFIRVDILIQDKHSKSIELIEVKSKSVSDETVASEFRNSSGKYDAKWLPYLYDVAFQAEVVRMAFPGYKVIPKLLLIDSSVACDVTGLHQLFPIITEKDPENGRSRIRVNTPDGVTFSSLGELNFLREVDVSNVVSDLRQKPIDNPAHVPQSAGTSMLTFMQWAGEVQIAGERVFHGLSKNCKNCQYRANEGDQLLSGVHECWQTALSQGLIHGAQKADDRSLPLSIDIWGGGSGSKSMADAVLKCGRGFLSDIQEEDIRPKNSGSGIGMTALERRMAQVNAVSGAGPATVLNESRLDEMDGWIWPLHMIDFETSAPAIPFFKGMHPYQTLAFQFSHHVMERSPSGSVRIRHASQWISTAAGRFPSFEFVRQLKSALMPCGHLNGTVFRYHNHENTVLRSLRSEIMKASDDVPDSEELIAFIDLVTKTTADEARLSGDHLGTNCMVDLHRLVQEGYFSSKSGGSISLKYVLPAILHDSCGVAQLYERPGLYGVGLGIQSLNFKEPGGHVWLQKSKGGDPYKTLPIIFGKEHLDLNEMLMRLAGDDDEDGVIAQGGLAMTAYNYTQFSSLSAQERMSIEGALLRYCELDTLAMVMLVQGLMELRGCPLEIETHCSH
jgi:Domain of unknown function(DUF2779)